ncbi:hypothetical protein BH23GEM9_BH23GEM9_14680 [soil metagenome]
MKPGASSRIGARLHQEHLDRLERAADAGRACAHRVLEPAALILYVAAGGFSRGFSAAAADTDERVICWTLEDLYAE